VNDAPYIGYVQVIRESVDPFQTIGLYTGLRYPDHDCYLFQTALNAGRAEALAEARAERGRRLDAHPPVAELREKVERLNRQIQEATRGYETASKQVETLRPQLTRALVAGDDPTPIETQLSASEADCTRFQQRLKQLTELRNAAYREHEKLRDEAKWRFTKEIKQETAAKRDELARKLAAPLLAELAEIHRLNGIISDL
jgi:small-conductance mechanosensitive channel